jgi:hypothetical protein
MFMMATDRQLGAFPHLEQTASVWNQAPSYWPGSSVT